VIELELVDRQHTIELHVGGLDPVDTVTGMQTRLHHLQYLEEPATGQMDDDTREALAAFQRDASLPVTGEIDQATFDALRSKYGC
jgi:peptidoglycan hydrolase-like protein with peptidoglycan-binding domain